MCGGRDLGALRHVLGSAVARGHSSALLGRVRAANFAIRGMFGGRERLPSQDGRTQAWCQSDCLPTPLPLCTEPPVNVQRLSFSLLCLSPSHTLYSARAVTSRPDAHWKNNDADYSFRRREDDATSTTNSHHGHDTQDIR